MKILRKERHWWYSQQDHWWQTLNIIIDTFNWILGWCLIWPSSVYYSHHLNKGPRGKTRTQLLNFHSCTLVLSLIYIQFQTNWEITVNIVLNKYRTEVLTKLLGEDYHQQHIGTGGNRKVRSIGREELICNQL